MTVVGCLIHIYESCIIYELTASIFKRKKNNIIPNHLDHFAVIRNDTISEASMN